jgi:hypothetical protein
MSHVQWGLLTSINPVRAVTLLGHVTSLQCGTVWEFLEFCLFSVGACTYWYQVFIRKKCLTNLVVGYLMVPNGA